MARSIPTGLITALTQGSIEPFYAIEMLFDTAPVRFWTGLGDRAIDGETYIGAGTLLEIGDIEEIGDLSAKSATITLSALSSEVVALALVEPYQRRVCRIMLGAIGATDVIEMFSGRMNTMTIEDAPDGASVSLTLESRLVELGRAKVRRYNHESHIARYPGDLFFSYVADLQDRQVVWGRTQA
jgi:hypothetical protein